MADGENSTPGGDGGHKGGDGVDLSGIRKPTGRPRKDGFAPGSPEARAADAGKSHHAKKPGKVESVVTDLDAEFVADAFVNLWEIGDELWANSFYERILKSVPDKAAEFKVELERVRLGEKDKTVAKKAVTALVKRYPFIAKWAPEIMLAATMGQYSLRMVRLSAFVAKIETAAKERGPREPNGKPVSVPLEVVSEHPQPGRS